LNVIKSKRLAASSAAACVVNLCGAVCIGAHRWMPFSLLANPTLAMLIELVPLAFVTMSSVAIAATAAASNRFNESPKVVVWLRARRPPTPRMHPGYGGCIGNPH
jgi:hypothetical protein